MFRTSQRSRVGFICSLVVIVGCSEVHELPFEPDAESDSALVVDAGILDAILAPDAVVDATLAGDAVVPNIDASVDAQMDARVLIDVCDNPNDLAGLAELGDDFQSILQEEGIPCFIASGGGAFFSMCIAAALSEYLSEDCALCVGQQADCLVTNCLDRCIADQGGQACLDCVCDAGCVENFSSCSGVDFGLFECPAP